MRRRYLHTLIALLAVLATSLSAMAQEIIVNVTPKNPILPPQLLLYVSDPSQFFTVQLSNTTSEEQRVYLSLGIEHVFPSDGLSVGTPDKYQPSKPFVVPANGVYNLTLVDMKNLFNHIPSSAMQIPDGLIDGYTNGSFGLLPEGKYQVQFNALRWTGNNQDTPYVLSGSTGGNAQFEVYYKASAPTWWIPMLGVGQSDFDVAEVNYANPMFSWTAPSMGGARTASYKYSIKFVEVQSFQTPDVAMDHNATVFQDELPTANTTTYLIGTNNKKNFTVGKTYAVQVTASQIGADKFNYVMLTNDGKSPLRVFRFVDDTETDGDDDENKYKYDFSMGEIDGLLDESALYNFRNPDIIEPSFVEGEVRKKYINSNINIEWTSPWYVGGEGQNPEDLKINYTVQLFNGHQTADVKTVMVDENLIYSKELNVTNDCIPWEMMEEKVSLNDHLVLRVVPHCLNEESVAFINDDLNVRDFVLRDHVMPSYFECSEMVQLDNTTPTTKSASDYKGKEVTIGQYQLVIDEIEGSGESGFTGKGRVRWDIKLGTLMVHVKFKDMKINNEDVVYEGDCESYSDPNKMTDLDAVNSIFSDLGLDDMVANTSVPYASQITEGGKKLISEKIDGIADYYSLVKGGKAIWDMLVNGAETDVYMPLCMPKDNKALSSLNSSPVDIQVTTMKFSPTSAMMNLIGEFTMPKSKCLASDLLVFGAPRLCISPDNLIPEAGTLALLDKFTVKDPSSGYQCTFNAPTDLLEPQNGCYIAWKDYKFEVLGVDMDMAIPKLKKVDNNGDVTEELPNLHIDAKIANWDDFLVNDITLDPFEADGLPGYTFTAQHIAYDHSLFYNATGMSGYKFPEEYKKEEAISEEELAAHGIAAWEGFYMGELTVEFPKGLTGDDNKRLSISVNDLLIDQSGLTLDAKVENLLKASAGGYAISIDKIGMSFLQSNFNSCYFDGSLTVPLIKTTKDEAAQLGFNCQIRKQKDDNGKVKDDFAYIFNTRNLNGDYKFDLFIAKLILEEKQTYFLLEAEPLLEKNDRGNKGDMDTRVELMLGGKIEIGGKAAAEGWLKDNFGFDFSIPDIHFVGMRLANCAPWKSKYVDFQIDLEKERSAQKSAALAGLYTEGKAFHNGKKDDASDCSIYFHTGSWSLASMSKKLGPFEFTLEDYNFDGTSFSDGKLDVGLQLTGKVAIVKGIDISASATMTLKGAVTGISTDIKNFDFSKIDCEFEKPELNALGVDASFCGVGLKGKVELENDKYSDSGKGFMASIDVTLPGELFSVHGDGGYFDYKDKDDSSNDYTWGWLHLCMKGTINVGPCSITKLGGGFYFNSRRNPEGDDKKAIKEKGLVGILMEFGMASPDGETITGDLSLNVVYNRPRKCLSNFTMTGNVKAAGGIINSNMTLVYENTPDDKYLQLNITVDSGLDDEALVSSLGDFAGDLGTLKEQMQKMAGDKYTEILTDCKQGLSNKIGTKAEEPKENLADNQPSPASNEESAAEVQQSGKTQKSGGISAMRTSISLDVKITWKAGGKVYNKPKWHVYLGTPDEDKRCSFTLIDFSSAVVTCKVGANGYVCVGNELPNGGELPPIPAKISNFLDGSQKGDFKSDNASTANASRSQAMSQFNGEISGGVMLGAQGYGYIDIDLGLLYGKVDAILGFDASVLHYKNGYCVNLKQVPGYRGWYGRGQLYAYLYMAMGVKFDLGFAAYDLKLAEAEVGGVMKLGGPKPTYFEGKARARVSLLGGLFKFNKSFSYECGQTCQMFRGNPLDDFILYDDCTLGDTIRSQGWYVEEKGKAVTSDVQPKVKVNVRTPQYVNTKAPLNEHFRLLDENELNRIAEQFGEGSQEWEDTKMQACRTFIFRDDQKYYLYEYSSPSQYKEEGTTVSETATFYWKNYYAINDMHGASSRVELKVSKTGNKSRHYLDMADLRSKLKPGKFYRLRAIGYSKEIEKGIEVDPFTYYNNAKNQGHIAWVNYVDYYFQTEAAEVIDDKAKLQDYVAIAYPSNKNLLRSDEGNRDAKSGLINHMPAFLNDVQAPTIALTEDIRTKAFTKGKLYWRLLNPMGGQVDIVENMYVENNLSGGIRTLNMEPARKLNAQANQSYILTLDYYTGSNMDTIYVAPEGSNLTEEEMKAATRQDPFIGKFNPYWQISAVPDTTLVCLYVKTRLSSQNWQTAAANDYDKPFIAQKLTSAKIDKPYSGTVSDRQIHENGYAMQSPFTFVSYMSNFAFPAGWEITERGFYNIEVTTSESLIFQNLRTGGKYEGIYSLDTPNSSDDAFYAVRDNAMYILPASRTSSQSGSKYVYPVQYPLSGYFNNDDYDYIQDVNDGISRFAPNSSQNYNNMTVPLFEPVMDFYQRTSSFSTWLNNTAQEVDYVQAQISSSGNNHDRHNSLKGKKQKLKEWYANHRGKYLTEYGEFVSGISDKHMFFVPCYQFPTVWSTTAAEGTEGAYKGLSNSSDRHAVSSPLWGYFTGRPYYVGKWVFIAQDAQKEQTYDVKEALTQRTFDINKACSDFKQATATAYRVNAYDMESSHYWTVGNLLNGKSEINFKITNPLTSEKSVVVTGEKGSYDRSASEGTSPSTKSVRVDTNTVDYGANYPSLSAACARVEELRNNIKIVYEYAEEQWKKYPSEASAIVKNSNNTIKSVDLAIENYLYHSTASLQGYEKAKTEAETHYKATTANLNQVYYCYSRTKPGAEQRVLVKNNNSSEYVTFSPVNDMIKELNQLMDNAISVASDSRSSQYKKYKSYQEECNSYVTKIQYWNDSLYNSRYLYKIVDGQPVRGHARHYHDVAQEAYKLLDNLTDANYKEYVDNRTSVVNSAIASKNRAYEADQLDTKARKYGSTITSALFTDSRKVIPDEVWHRRLAQTLKTVAYAQAFIKLLDDSIPACKKHIQTNISEISGKTTMLDKLVNTYVGADGKSGYYAKAVKLFSDRYIGCKNILEDVLIISENKELIEKIASNLTEYASNLPSEERRIEVRTEAQHIMWRLQGKDVDAADRMLKHLSDLEKKAAQMLSVYEEENDRHYYLNQSTDEFDKVAKAYQSFRGGDMVLGRQNTQDYYQAYANMKLDEKMKAYWDKALADEEEVKLMISPLIDTLEMAKFSSRDELYQEVQARWNKVADQTTFDEWNEDLHQSWAKIGSQMATAEEYNKQASSAFYDSSDPAMIQFIYSKVCDLSGDMSNAIGTAPTKLQYTPIWVQNGLKEATNQWDVYELSLVDDYGNWVYSLQQCIDQCTKCNGYVDDVRKIRDNEELVPQLEEIYDLARQYVRYLPYGHSVPLWASRITDARSRFAGMADKIEEAKQYQTKANECLASMRDSYDNGIVPLEKKAQEALDYLYANGQPNRPVASMMKGYLKKIESNKEYADGCYNYNGENLTTALNLKSKCATICKTLNTAASEWDSFLASDPNLTAMKTAVTRVQTQATQLGEYTTQLSESYNASNLMYDDLQMYYTTCQDYLDYMQEHAASDQERYAKGKALVAEIQALGLKVANELPSLKTSLNTSLKVLQSTQELLTKMNADVTKKQAALNTAIKTASSTTSSTSTTRVTSSSTLRTTTTTRLRSTTNTSN